MKKSRKRKVKEIRFQIRIELILIILLILSYVPMLLMLFLSSKTNLEIYNNFFAFPKSFIWSNYTNGFSYLVGKGCLENAEFENMKIISTNLGFEMMGDFDAAFMLRKLSLTGK